MRPADNVNKLIKKLHLTASSELDKRVHDDITKALAETHKTKSAKHMPNIWRIIMKSRMTKLAAAAVIIIAILAGLPFITTNPQGIALADVLEKIEQAHAYMYTVEMKVTGSMLPSAQEQTTTTIVSDDYGRKSYLELTDPNTGKTTTQEEYTLPEQKMIVIIMPEKKQYMRMPFGDEFLAMMKQQNNDPRVIIKRIMACEYTELGRSVIDGVEVEGFRTTDPAFLSALDGDTTSFELTLWVDAENWLPFRSEWDFKSGEKMQRSGATYDYRWNVPVQASEFEPVIPEDFKPFPGYGMKLPSMNEEGAIEGLGLFAEMTGKYPKTLNMLELSQEITALKDSQYLKEKLRKFHDQMSDEIPKEERFNALVKKSAEMIQPLPSIGLFYMMLVANKKEPVYYGESVGPDDADKVLLKWKVSDDQYRVIFGDLTAEDVTAEQLAELEADH